MHHAWMQRIESNRILLFASALIFIAYIRLFYGVDFLDESGYAGIPYSFSLGARPFFDEVATTQNVGILLIPILKLYNLIVPSADFLVLVTRHLYFLLTFYSSWCVFSFAKNFIKNDFALLGSLLPLVFTFFSIPNLSYNTLAILGLLVGTISYLKLLLIRESPISNTLVGTSFFALATYGYPTFAMISFPAIIFTFIRTQYVFPKESRRSIHLTTIAVSLFWTTFALVCLQYAGFENILKTIHYYRMFGTNFGGSEKFKWIMTSFWENIYYLFAILAGFFAIWISKFQSKLISLVNLAIALTLFLSLWVIPNSPMPSMNLVIFLGLIPLVFFKKKSQLQSVDVRFFWFLSFLSSLVFAWTSSNGLSNASIGLLTGAVLNLLILSSFIEMAPHSNLRNSTCKIFISLYLIAVLFLCSRYVYPSQYILNMNSLVTHGAFKGLLTTADKKSLIDELSQDLRMQMPSAKSVIFFNDFPAGYLFSNLRRHAQSCWTPSAGITPQFLEERVNNILGYYDSKDKLPDLAVYMIPSVKPEDDKLSTLKISDPVFDFFSSPPYRTILEKPRYIIFQRFN